MSAQAVTGAPRFREPGWAPEEGQGDVSHGAPSRGQALVRARRTEAVFAARVCALGKENEMLKKLMIWLRHAALVLMVLMPYSLWVYMRASGAKAGLVREVSGEQPGEVI